MLSQIICLSLLGGVLGKDVLLESMCGAHGGNRVSLCAGGAGGSACPAALVDPRFVFARASCLEGRHLHELHILRSKQPLICQELFQQGVEWKAIRKAQRQFLHPQFSTAPEQFDAALLQLDQAYITMDDLINSTATYMMLDKLQPWIKAILKKYPVNTTQTRYYRTNPLTSPEQMFLMAVVLPTVSFILFFLFITSSNKTNNYKAIDEDREDATVI